MRSYVELTFAHDIVPGTGLLTKSGYPRKKYHENLLSLLFCQRFPSNLFIIVSAVAYLIIETPFPLILRETIQCK